MIRLQLMGRLGQHATESAVNGKTVINFSVAHNEKFKNQQGVQQERTVWVNCSLWEQNSVLPYLTQGKGVYLEGVPSVNMFRSNAGEPKAEIKLRVSFLQLLPDGRPAADNQEAPPAVSQPSDDLPF